MGEPVWVPSKTLGRPVIMGYTEGDTLTCFKDEDDWVRAFDHRLGLDSGGLIQAQGRGVTWVVMVVEGVTVMECPLSQWLAAEETRLGDENPQRFLGPQDVGQGEAKL